MAAPDTGGQPTALRKYELARTRIRGKKINEEWLRMTFIFTALLQTFYRSNNQYERIIRGCIRMD